MQAAVGLQNTVEPAQIERELTRIWREAASADLATEANAGETPPRIKSTLSNLVIVVRGETPTRAQLDSLITELVITHPSRFFVVRFDDGHAGAAALETSVSSRCVLANSGKHVCSEEVYVVARPDGVQHVPNLLLSLFVADVEVVLIFPSDCAGEAAAVGPFANLIRGVESLCDRVVYDSAAFGSYHREVSPLLGLSQEEFAVIPHEVKLRDLNWSRIERWRMLVAEQFSAKRFRDAAGSITRIEFTCDVPDSKSHLPADALLLAGWIVSCVGWELKMLLPKSFVPGENSKGRWAVGCIGKNGQSCAVEFVAVYGAKGSIEGSNLGALSQVSISLNQPDAASVVTIRRDVQNNAAEASMVTYADGETKSGVQSAPRRSPFPVRAVEDLLLSNVVTSSGKEDYRRALESSLQIASMIGI